MSGRSSPSRQPKSKATVAVAAAIISSKKKKMSDVAASKKAAKKKQRKRQAAESASQKIQQQHEDELEEDGHKAKKAKKSNEEIPTLSEQQQMRAAKAFSFYNTLHIDVLYEWAADYDTFLEANLEKKEEDRDDIISWLMNNAPKIPTREEAFNNWRLRLDIDQSDDIQPPTLGTSTTTYTPPLTASSPAAAASSIPTSSTFVPIRSSDNDLISSATSLACCHCGSDRLVAGLANIFPCGICFFISGKSTSSAVNAKEAVGLRAQAQSIKDQAANAASLQSTSTSSNSGGKEDTNKLSIADKELERLAADGASYPHFLDLSPISAADALLDIRLSKNGPLFAHTSISLVKLIQSGKLMVPGWAIPITALEASVEKDRDQHGELIKLKEGKLSTTAALRHRSIPNLTSLCNAFVSNIGPSLFNQPRALLDWFGLIRSVINIEAETDWDTAYKYLMTTLSEKVPLRKSFGEFDKRIMDAVASPTGTYNKGNNSSTSTTSSSSSFPHNDDHALSSHITLHADDNYCRKWNLFTCTEPCPSGRTHACMWKACKGAAHRGRECKNNPQLNGKQSTPAAARRSFNNNKKK